MNSFHNNYYDFMKIIKKIYNKFKFFLQIIIKATIEHVLEFLEKYKSLYNIILDINI